MSTWAEVSIGDRIRISHEFTVRDFSTVNGNPVTVYLQGGGTMPCTPFTVEILQKRLEAGDIVRGLPDLPSGSVVCIIPEQRADPKQGRWVRIDKGWYPTHRSPHDILIAGEVGDFDYTAYVIEYIPGDPE